MQGRYRDDGRGYNSPNPNYRHFNNRNYNNNYSNRNNSFNNRGRPYLPPPPPSKQEIMMKAGKLAAEYLVSQGLLDASLLPENKWQNGKYSDFKWQNRVPGNSRRYDDDCYNNDSFRGKRRVSGFDREYDDNENEDEYAHGYSYNRERRSGFDQLPTRSENTMESGSENQEFTEDSGSKISSSSMKRDTFCEVVGDNVVVNAELGDEVKSDASGDDSKKKSLVEENEGESSKIVNDEVTDLPANESPKMEQENNAEENKVVLKEEEKEADMNVQDVSNKRKREDEEDLQVSNVKTKTSNPDEEVVTDEETVAPIEIDEETVALIAVDEENAEGEEDEKVEGEKQLSPAASFKTCDLNLLHAPEITEIPDAPEITEIPDAPEITTIPDAPEITEIPNAPEITEIPDDLEPSKMENEKQLSMNFDLSIGKNNNGADEVKLSDDDDKVVQVINIDDDVAMDASASDPSKVKEEPISEERIREEPIYPNLDNFLNQSDHVDLTNMQDGYSLEFSDFLGTDITRCPSVPSDLNNLESGMGLHDTEVVPNDDDSIYVSLGEIPIAFMEVWDQPPQDYGKFF